MINLNEDTNKSLYYNIDECLDFCKNISEDTYEDFTYFHMFWNVGLQPSQKHTLPIKSYLCTQNLKNTKLIVWSNVDLTSNEYLSVFFTKHKDNVLFRIYDPMIEAKGTLLENKSNILSASDTLNWSKGDLFRLLTLYNFGGVYVDFDVVFLRDFAPLLSQEFMYKWGREENMINGAVMRLFRNSQLANDLLREISVGPVIPASTNWSTNLYEKVRKYNTNWTIFPAGFFDSEWQDTRIALFNPMKKYGVMLTTNYLDGSKIYTENFNLYDGSFSWHWHNKWSDEIENESKFYVISEIITKKYSQLYK